jgi:hypothetical protein
LDVVLVCEKGMFDRVTARTRGRGLISAFSASHLANSRMLRAAAPSDLHQYYHSVASDISLVVSR